MRLYESHRAARPQATIRAGWPIASAGRTNALEEEEARPLETTGSAIEIHLDAVRDRDRVRDPRARGRWGRPGSDAGSDLAGRIEAAQPVFADYWLHNKGAAPMGYQPVTVQIKPSYLTVDGAFNLPCGRGLGTNRRGCRAGPSR